MQQKVIIILLLIFNIYNVNAGNTYNLIKKANAYFIDRKYNEAIDAYNVINKKYDIKEVKINLARCNYFLQNYTIAESQYQKIIDIPNINFEIYKEYATILEKRNKKAEAQLWFQKYKLELENQKDFLTAIPKREENVESIVLLKQDSIASKVKANKDSIKTAKIKSETVAKQKTKQDSIASKVKARKDSIKTAKIKTETVAKQKPKQDSIAPKVKASKDSIKTAKIKTETVAKQKPKQDSIAPKVKASKDSIKTAKIKTEAVAKQKPKQDSIASKVKANKDSIKTAKIKTETVAKQKPKQDSIAPKVKASKDKNLDLIYKINLATFLKDPGVKYFDDIASYGKITFTKQDKFTIYYLEDYKKFEDANKILSKINKGFYEEAFIVAFYKGKEVDISEAIRIQTQP
jgi:tetratricopeptide (TPR) repeat protein